MNKAVEINTFFGRVYPPLWAESVHLDSPRHQVREREYDTQEEDFKKEFLNLEDSSKYIYSDWNWIDYTKERQEEGRMDKPVKNDSQECRCCDVCGYGVFCDKRFYDTTDSLFLGIDSDEEL